MNDATIAVQLAPERTEGLMSGLRGQVRARLAAKECVPPVFGLHLSPLTHDEVADLVLDTPRSRYDGAGLVATANIQHIAIMRNSAEFTEAMQGADLVTADGFPVARYANYCGCNIGTRTTGRDIVADIMNDRVIAEHHRLYFVVDGDETAEAMKRWAVQKGMADRLEVEIPPQGFIRNDAYCRELAGRIRDYGTTIVLMCTGAPQSEIFAYRYREFMSPCWILCVGQSARIVLGLAPTPPRIVETLSIEWLWRMWLEPRRLVRRYVTSTIGFLAAVMEDSRKRSNA